ncbi:MAG TPA: DUF6077 domain-containing protein [Rubrobacter sp.]|nr:DUF6077 domain-containing protein [Rubrobacter sp.]
MSRLRTLDARIVLLGAAALVPLGPLRAAFAGAPIVIYLCVLCLFMVPGIVLVSLLFRDLPGPVVVPVSFAGSVGVFALLGVPFLAMGLGLGPYLWVAGAIVAASLAAAAAGALSRKHPWQEGARVHPPSVWLWGLFLLLCAALASVYQIKEPFPYDDIWVYLAWVREFLEAGSGPLREPYFGDPVGTSRAQINGWLLEQAALSRASGIDPVELVLGYLVPTLVVMSLLAFYALARVLMRSGTAALLVGSLYALGLLLDLGGRWIGRVAEDKFLAWFLFLPVALIFAVLFLEGRKKRHLAVFGFFCWAVVAVHPVGLAIIGLSAAGLGLLHLAANWREREAWTGAAGLAGALLSVLLAPLLYLLATGDSLVAALRSADISSGDPVVLANMVFVKPEWHRVLELGNGYYVVHPAQLLNPVIPVAFLVGLPFLFFRLKRSPAAQLLAGMLVVPAFVCFVPPVATFFGDHVILPGQMWRLAWPIPLAASLTVGWILWETTRLARAGLRGCGGSRSLGRFLPLVLVCALVVAAAPVSAGKAMAVYQAFGGARSAGMCFDPAFSWVRDHVEEPSVVLAPDLENTCIPAYSAQANVVSLRGGLLLRVLPALQSRVPGRVEVPRGALDARSFFYDSTLEEKLRIVERYDADYVMVRAGSPLNETLGSRPGFAEVYTSAGGYSLYAVNREELGL